MATEQEDFQALSITDRLQHKVWKARQSAYTELYDLFRKTVNDSDFVQYEGCLKSIATDVNAVAQETGLNTIYEYVNNAPHPAKTSQTVVPALVAKCLGAPKAGTKQKATDIILLYAEVDAVDPIVELVLPGIQTKQPKLVTQTVVVLRELLRQFGIQTVNPKPLIKILPHLFGHIDKNVRAEAFTLTVEIYKWIGSALSPSLSDLKPVQMKELEEAFGKLPPQRPSPERLLRSEQRKMAEVTAMEVEIGESHGDNEVMEEPVDPYDFADPVDITAKLPGNFYELLASKKWQERREALDMLLASAKAPKVMDKDYSELMGALAKRINDANILLVGVTANCIENIASGLRADFGKYREVVLPPLIEKLKERKPAILEQLVNALHGVFSHMSILDIIESIGIAVKHKNPQIRTQSVKLVTRQLQIMPKMPSKLETKTLAEFYLKVLDDADGSSREASAGGLGTLMKVVGERPMLPFIDSLDDIKKNKIKEFCDKAQIKTKQAMVKKQGAPRTTTVPPTKKVIRAHKSTPSQPESMMIDDGPAVPISTAPTKKRRLSTTASTTTRIAKKPPHSVSRPKMSTAPSTNVQSTSKKATRLPPSSGPEEVKFKYSPEEAEARVTEYIPENIWQDIGSGVWKVRLAAMESLCTYLGSSVESSSIEAEIIIRCLSKKPGWKEMNFQVMTKLYNAMQLLAVDCSSFSRSCVALGIPGIVEKLGDAKLKKPASECLVAFAESTSLQFVLSQSYPIWKKAKSPKIVTDSLIWIHQAILDFGVVGLEARDLIDFLKNALANTNPVVRTNAVTVLGVLRMYLGADIIAFVQDVSPALMVTIENEFEKVSQLTPPQPTKSAAAHKTKASNSKSHASIAGHNAINDALNSLIPRTDIATQLGKVASECNDANWKKRKEGLDQVVSIIEGANKRIKPNLGDFPGVLKQRLGDSNKILQIQAVGITGMLALSMGKPFEKYVKFLSGNITSVLSDNKASVRNAGLATLDTIRETCGLDGLIGAFGTHLASDSPILRKELMTWLLKHLNEQHESMAMTDYSPLISPILSCLQDRNGEVRKAAQTILPAVAMFTGFEKVMRKVSELNNIQRQMVTPFVDSIRGSVPATPTKPPSSTTTSSTTNAKRLSTTSIPSSPIAPPPEPHSDFTMTTTTTAAIGLGYDSEGHVSGSSRRISSDSWNSTMGTTTRSARLSSSPPSPLRNNLPPPISQAQPPLLTDDIRAKQLRGKREPRWQFDTSRTDLIDILQCTSESHIQPDIWRLMFSSAYNAERDRLHALEQLDECITKSELSMDKYGLDFGDMKKRYMANTDLLFKYLTIRFFDTSTSMLIKCLDLTQHLVDLLDSEGAILSEYEAVSFIPFLIHKIGDPKETIRIKIRSILNSVCTVYPPSKMVNFLLDSAGNSKNPKARMECLEEIGTLLQQNGMSVMLPHKALPLIAEHVGDRDSGVRNAALNTIAQAYILIGDPVYKYFKRLGEKEKGLVSERLKRISPLPKSDVGNDDNAQQPQQRDADAMDIDDVPPTKQPPRSSVGSARSHPSSLSSSSHINNRNSPRAQPTASPMDVVNHEYENTVTAQASEIEESQVSRAARRQSAAHSPQQRQQPEQQVDGVDNIVERLSHSTNPEKTIDTLKRLVKYLNTTPDIVLPQIDALVNAIVIQVRVAYSIIGSPGSMTIRLCKHVVNTLVVLFSKRDLAGAVHRETLISLLEELAGRLLDERILLVESGPQLSKALNVAMVKTLENCQQNIIFSALLSILGNWASKLRPNDSATGMETKYTELMMKCLWKLAKTIQQNLRSGALQPNQLLFDINAFFLLTPPDEWKRRVRENVPLGELPLRTAKTLLLEIVTGLGEHVSEHLTLIDDPQNSRIYPYLRHMLDDYKKKGGNQPQQHQPPTNITRKEDHTTTGQQFTSSSSLSLQPSTLNQHQHRQIESTASTIHPQNSPRNQSSPISSIPSEQSKLETAQQQTPFSRFTTELTTHQLSPELSSRNSISSITTPLSDNDINDVLKRIFEKIGTRDETKQGIMELYEFQKKHPLVESKVNGYLSKTGSYFQRYIQRGLDSLAAEDKLG